MASGSILQNRMETNKESTNLRELAYVRRRPVEGHGTRSIPSKIVTSKAHYRQNSASASTQDNKSLDFIYYDDESEDEDAVAATENSYDISCNFVDCMMNRQRGDHRKFQTMKLSSEYGTRHMLSNSMLKEHEIKIGNMNKVFCSQWLSHKQVIFGTKCNKLVVMDVSTKKIDHIPSLQSSETSVPPDLERGINSIEINPSRTLLSTGASNSNDVAVYRLPTLDPICVGQFGHKDWIFDQTWIDDQFLVSGSRDGSISLWRVTDQIIEEVTEADIPVHQYMSPLLTKKCKQADKVRALCYNGCAQEIAVISLNSFIHCWNAVTMKQIMSKKLPHTLENCCLTTDEEYQLYAVGSKSHADLLDSRTLQSVRKISSRSSGCGIRSVSFKGNILTLGTGTGLLLFWDLRACKFLESTMNSNRAVQLKAGRGWVERNDSFMDAYQPNKYTPAIYTHCYDGNYVGLYQ
ncbi:DDB1- and CUL4-associated factor 12 isoform X2 [Eurytemora carolleeae]|uniref:DDB1- and CUL4-associated factor 12 isoform X2 n=1 Tax=Eurytemora carolleeae TaxID=1294199 RepID=UPI000C7761AA|nr:DDB1- and CUL4-associated factor 12 isoform X2 [Eurytemora carolleeae]|eukprot:XP_023320143.1 DDB1- and CUL4-associated factor 12-like isoform X2 [Eurytemora affinis]